MTQKLAYTLATGCAILACHLEQAADRLDDLEHWLVTHTRG